jgi:hypothetical protein
VDSEIEARIKSECDLRAVVVCPANIPRQRGYAFTCVAMTRSTVRDKQRLARATLTVFQSGDHGDITLRTPRLRGP